MSDETTKMLRLDASEVPRIYRLVAKSCGEAVGQTTVQRFESEIVTTVETVRQALVDEGYDNVSVDYWPA